MYCKTAFLLSAVLVLGLAGIPHQADAATRYVDAVHGNDSYPGTSTQPWKSMSKATGAVSPGDVVYLRPGNYGVVTIDRGYGTAGAWVTYQADPSTVRARAGTWYEGTISRPDSTRDVVFTGLYLAPRASGSYAAGHYITLDGVNVVGSEVRFQRYVAYFVLKNCNIFGAMPADPVYHLSNERTLRAVYFDMESAGSDFHNVSIDSCYMELVRTGVMMSAQFRDNVIIRNCHIRDTNSSCVHLQDYETNVGTITVDGCHLELQILKADTVKLSTTVDAPVSSAPNRMFKYAGADPTYSYWADVEDLTTGRREVRRVSNIDKSTNTVTLDKALSFGMARGDKVRFFDANHGSGIAIRCGRLAIRNNRIHNTGATAGIYNYLDGAGNLLIENNLVYDVVQGSTIVNFGDNPIGNNVTIRNNTFVGRRAASYPSQPQYRYGPTFRFSAYTGTNQATLNVSNNIFVGGAVGAPSNSGICRNNICYYASGYESDSSGGNRGNLVYYQGQSYPYEPAPFDGSGAFFAGGANFDKAFTGHHGYNFNQAFQLASGSKAIGFAAATYSSKTDILNRTRDSQPDDGCYEYGAGSVPSTPTTPTTPTAPTNPTSPTTWGSRTIGTSTLGNLVRDGSTFKVTGNGENIWGTADGFHFVYRELSGDGSITARVTGTGAGTSIWAKGGVMIRDSLTANSKHAMMALLSGGGNGARFQWRSSDGGQSYMGPDPSSVVKPPYWVKVVRAGNYLSGYLSADGVTWRQLGPTKAIYMANPVYIGLCVSARASGQLRTFTFDNVSTTGNVAGAGSVPTAPSTPTTPTNPTSPTGWGSRTLGTSILGNLVRDGSTFKVTGNGENIWGTADGFHFVYRELSGDGSITARVTGTGAGTSIWAKGGVMIRDSLTAGSKHAMMALLSGGGNDARFQWRSSDGGQSYMGPDPSSVVKPPYWVKVVRAGNYLSGYLSADGVTWRQLGPTKAIYMANPVYVGLCVSARAGGQLRTFTFDNVSTTGNVAANSIKAMAATPAPAGAAASTSLRSVRPTPAEVVVSRGTDGGTTSKPAAAETDTERSDPEPAATSDALVGQAGPSGWWSETIGTAAEGNAVINGDSFEVAGGGADIWGTADGFHYLYKQLTGDGSMIARVVGNGAGSNTWAKGGVMIRNTTAAGSEHAMMVVTGGDGNGASFQWRPAADGVSSNSDNAGAAVTPPHWVKIERVGNQFSALLSADGQTWEPLGQAQTIDMTDPVCIGLCVTSHASGELRTYTFDNVSFTGQVSDRPPQLKAYDPIPADGSMGSETPLFSWMPGETAVLHNVYFGATPELTEANLMAASQPINVYYHVPGLEPGVTYYWRVDEIDAAGAVTTGDVWSVTATPRTACNPVPADDAQGVFPAPTLHWAAGQLAVQHQVYFSSDFADVNEGAAEADGGLVDETAFYPGVLRASTTYYWRVDEVQPDGTVLAGPVWSLTTDAGVVGKVVRQWWSNIGGTAVSDLTGSPDYPNHPTGSELVDAFEGPVDWADNYGTRLYGWLTPPESGEYTFWVSGDDAQELWLSSDADPANASIIASVASWTASREWEKEAGQKSAAITLQAGRKYFIQVLGKEGGGGDSTAVAWQGPGIDGRQVISGEYVDTFALPPLHAFSPNPAHGATDVVQTPVLSWSAGEQAEHHEIYFGGDQAAVAEADAGSVLFLSRQAENAVEVGALGWGETYYWRVDEVGAAETWKGTVWSFTTANFIPIDDMESYTDEEGSRIYEAWIDGYTSGNSGSVVGYLEAPFAEQQIVHGGRQSMPLEYNNAAAPFYSEATLTLAAPQDWTANGVTDLSLWFRGHPVSFMETADGAITMSAAGADIWGTADQFRYAYQGLSGDGSIVVKVESIVNTDAWAKAGVIIREMLDPSSAFAYVVVTPGQGVSFGWRSSAGGECGSATMAGIHAPQWVRLTRTGNTFTAQYSSDGAAWQDVADAEGRPVSQDIAMAADVTAGLCVTSHNPGAVTTARTSGFTTTGGVTGPWQLADIGVAQPGNDPAPLYVVVEDSAGKAAVSVNPDPQAVLTTEWTRWNIPLSDLTGVNLAAVRKLSVGVGDKANPQAGGIGRIYLDDVRVARPEPSEEPSQPTTQ